MAIMFWFWQLSLVGFLGWVLWWDKHRPKRNSLGWRHPDKGGGLEWFWTNDIEDKKPYLIKYDLWSINYKPVYLWYEDEYGDYQAYEPKPDGVLSPNGLFDLLDWQCSREFEAVSSKVMEAVKVGMGVAMMGICLFGIMIVMDMINKGGV